MVEGGVPRVEGDEVGHCAVGNTPTTPPSRSRHPNNAALNPYARGRRTARTVRAGGVRVPTAIIGVIHVRFPSWQPSSTLDHTLSYGGIGLT